MKNKFNLLFILIVMTHMLSSCSKSNNDLKNIAVNFNSQGGSSVSSQTVPKGSLLKEPDAPVKQNQAFRGWFKEADCIHLWNFETDVATTDVELYAKWGATNTLVWGMNIHGGGDNPMSLIKELKVRNYKSVRMDYWGSSTFRDVVAGLKQNGIVTEAILYSVFSKGQNRYKDYDADLAEVEQTAYTNTKAQVEKIKDIVSVFELQNEVPLYENMIKAGGDNGLKASDYDTPASRLQAAVLRGMSKAVDDVRKELRLPIRIILGTVSNRYGFLTYMQEQGVIFDIVGYHIYLRYTSKPIDQDPWYGEGGALGQLAKFNKPIHVNEFNCGEIYAGAPGKALVDGNAYENEEGKPATETGFKSLYKHLNVFVNNTNASIESIHFYEAFDETQKTIPENRFGFYYDHALTQPKVSALLGALFAGGKLSNAELEKLNSKEFIY